jgi:hypothetical protein
MEFFFWLHTMNNSALRDAVNARAKIWQRGTFASPAALTGSCGTLADASSSEVTP